MIGWAVVICLTLMVVGLTADESKPESLLVRLLAASALSVGATGILAIGGWGMLTMVFP